MLCLIQAAAPATPFIYAPALAIMDPRSGRYSAGAIGNGLLGAAAVEMARYYGLPAEGSGGGTSHYVPSIQAGYERAMNALLPVLSWPDLVVGPGLLGGSMILSLEQLFLLSYRNYVAALRFCKGTATVSLCPNSPKKLQRGPEPVTSSLLPKEESVGFWPTNHYQQSFDLTANLAACYNL